VAGAGWDWPVEDVTLATKRRRRPSGLSEYGVGAVQNYNNVPYDFLEHGDRRKAERRREQLDRRGILRWDPQMKDRRLMRERRAGLSGPGRR
jgi:hypothetical protein